VLPRNDDEITYQKPRHPSSSPLRPSSSDAAGPSSGPKKRSRSPSPTRDAPSAVEHEGPEMTGKSPGAKRRRLQNDDSPLDDVQADSPAADPKASTKKRVLEVEDSDDPFVSPLLFLGASLFPSSATRNNLPLSLTSRLSCRMTKARPSQRRESRFLRPTRKFWIATPLKAATQTTRPRRDLCGARLFQYYSGTPCTDMHDQVRFQTIQLYRR
jgi:hypothetical protein